MRGSRVISYSDCYESYMYVRGPARTQWDHLVTVGRRMDT